MIRAIVILALLAAPAGGYRMPVIEVRGEHLTIDEVISRTARVEEEAARSEVPRRFTSHVRLVAIYGDTTNPRCKREVLDQVSRVEEGPGPLAGRSVLLWERTEKLRGDSLIESKSEVTAKSRFTPQIEAIRKIPLALQSGLFHYQILERLKLPEESLIHVAYRPRQEFASLPDGDAWIDTRNYAVLWQTGSITRNVPLPVLLRSIDSFSIHRSKYGPVWIEDAMIMRLTLRHTPGGPDRIQFSIRLSDVAVGGEAAAPPESDAMSASTAALIDSLQIGDRGRADPLLRQPLVLETIRATSRGDSLLLSMSGSPPIRPYGWRPYLRYGHAERLFTGLGFTIGRGPGYPFSLDLDGGYASALEHMTGSARIEIASGKIMGRRVGGWVRGESQVQRFDPIFPAVDFLDAITEGHDSHDAFFRRSGEGGIWVGRGKAYRLSLSGRIDRDRVMESRKLWNIFGRPSRPGPFRAIDPGETRMLAGDLRFRGGRIAPWLTVDVRGETGRTAPLGSGFVGTRDLRSTIVARPILPGGRRLVVRGTGAMGDADLPLQDRLYLGGGLTLRGYDKGALTGRNGYHVGGEFFLNQDIVGWLPWIPDRGLGLEAFLAGDHGRILSDRSERAGDRTGALTSVGIGFAWPVGMPGLSRILVGLHRGLERGDREWRVRLDAESTESEGTGGAH